MPDLLGRLLDPAYLYVQRETARQGLSLGMVVWLLLMLGEGLGLWLLRPRAKKSFKGGRVTDAAIGFAGLAALSVAARAMVAGPLSARVWSVSASLVALILGGAAFVLAFLPEQVKRRVEMLGRLGHRPAVRGLILVGGYLFHALGLLLLQSLGLPAWVFGLLIVVLIVSCLAARSRGNLCSWPVMGLRLLLPWTMAYLSALLILYAGVRGYPLEAYRAFAYPDLISPWFDLEAMVAASAGAMLIYALILATPPRLGRYNSRILAVKLALVALMLWYVWVATVHRTHGVTGSDPYCYVQMASDLVETGSVLHRFALVERVRDLGLSLWPVAHVGYHPPLDGRAATVWPIGWPLLLAPALALGSEVATFWMAPLCLLLSALLAYLVAVKTFAESKATERALAGVLSAALLLTSGESVLRSMVPMADAAAMLASLVMLYALLRANDEDSLLWSGIAGAAFAAGYWIRHPQLFVGAAALPIVWSTRRRWWHWAIFFGLALLLASPDLAYHARVFGSPWITESREWHLIALDNVLPVMGGLLRSGWLRQDEFGYLWPLILIGIVCSKKLLSRGLWYGLLLGFALPLLFYLCYQPLRWRDLIPLFPWLALWAGQGLICLQRRCVSQGSGQVKILILVGTVAWLLAVRTLPILCLPGQERIDLFGHVTAGQRQEYARLARTLPRDAVVGTGLNSGSIERYADCDSLRPAYWNEVEIGRLVTSLQSDGLAIYLLDDGEEMAELVGRLRETMPLTRVDGYAIPVMGKGGQVMDRPAILYCIMAE